MDSVKEGDDHNVSTDDERDEPTVPSVARAFWQTAMLGPGSTCDAYMIVPTCLVNGFAAHPTGVAGATAPVDEQRALLVAMTHQCALCDKQLQDKTVVFSALRIASGVTSAEHGAKKICAVRLCMLCKECGAPRAGPIMLNYRPDQRQDNLLYDWAEKSLAMDGPAVDFFLEHWDGTRPSWIRHLLMLGNERHYAHYMKQMQKLEHDTCAMCGKPQAPKRCSSCRVRLFCNAECAKLAWTHGHKQECKAFVRDRCVWRVSEVVEK